MTDLLSKYTRPESESTSSEEIDPPRLSYGTDPAMKSIIEKIQNKEVDTVCINIATLVRNLLEKDTDIDTATSVLMENMELLVSDLSIAFSGSNVNNPHVYFYLMPHHKMIPSMRTPPGVSKADPIIDNFSRPLKSSKTRQMIFDVCRHYVRYRNSARMPTTTNVKVDNLFVTTQIVSEGVFIVNDSSLNIKKTADEASYNIMYKMLCSFKNARKPIILTHQAMDAHLLEKFPGFLVNSFTGNILTYQNCNTYFFKNEHIPFTRITHVCFGDRELVTGCLRSKEKKMLLELSETEKWRLKPSMKVDMYLKETYKLPYSLQ